MEDTDTSFSEIEGHFGVEVRRIVEEVTDDKTLPKLERKRLQIDHATHVSQAAKLVKLADKLYNLRDLNRCTPQGMTHRGGRGRPVGGLYFLMLQNKSIFKYFFPTPTLGLAVVYHV